MVVDYDPSESFLVTAFTWGCTVLPFVLKRREFWLFMALHLMIGHLYRDGYLEGADQSKALYFMDWNDMKVISAITTFFVVFYSNQIFNRYQKLYSDTRNLITKITEFTFEVSLHVKESSLAHARLTSRFFLAATVVFFSEMKVNTSTKEFEQFIEQGILKEPEVEHIEKFYKQQRSLILLHWAAKVVREGHSIAVKEKKAPANALKSMIDKLVGARQSMQEVVDTLCLPVPFQYFHLLNVMIVVNLLLWAYVMAITDSAFAPIVYFFAALIFMGMMELASQLSDPFGDDDTDFPISKWISETIVDAAVILEYAYIGEEEGTWRTALAEESRLRSQLATTRPKINMPDGK